MKKLLLITALTSTLFAGIAHAQDFRIDTPVSLNVDVVSDYRFRGISQSDLLPAVQGGAEIALDDTGLYAGTWLSTIKWITDIGGNGNVEWDVYAGMKGQVVDGISYDVGVLTYVYPANNLPTDANTTEAYGQLGYGPAYVKYSYSLTNLFAFSDSKGSGYLDVGANIKLPQRYSINLHAGHQSVANFSAASYSDWKVGVTKDFGVVTGSVAVIGTNTSEYDNVGFFGNVQNLGQTAVVLSISKKI